MAKNAEYDSAWCAHDEELYLSPSKKNLKIENYWSEIELKKFVWNWKIELAINAGYDPTWSAHHEKLYLSA